MRPILRLLMLVMCSAAVAVQAASPDAKPDPRILTSQGFLAHHPDMRWRLQGMEAYDQGLHKAAAGYFRLAARFADKPSQAMLAQMLWDGQGVEQDRALAYAWMDLAAERAYPVFLAKREQYWEALDAAERERALREGQAVYETYGDDVAKPRLERKLDRGRRNITGSRVGFVGALQIRIPGPGGWIEIGGDDYYNETYWKPEKYWTWQDTTWKAPVTGRVDIGEILSAPAETPPQD